MRKLNPHASEINIEKVAIIDFHNQHPKWSKVKSMFKNDDIYEFVRDYEEYTGVTDLTDRINTMTYIISCNKWKYPSDVFI